MLILENSLLLWEKSNCTVNPRTGCVTLDRAINWWLALSHSHFCGATLVCFSLQNCSNSSTLKGFFHESCNLFTFPLGLIKFLWFWCKSEFWLKQCKTFVFFGIQSWTCCITQMCSSSRVQTDGWTFSDQEQNSLLSVTESHPGAEAAKWPQTITLPVPCLTG